MYLFTLKKKCRWRNSGSKWPLMLRTDFLPPVKNLQHSTFWNAIKFSEETRSSENTWVWLEKLWPQGLTAPLHPYPKMSEELAGFGDKRWMSYVDIIPWAETVKGDGNRPDTWMQQHHSRGMFLRALQTFHRFAGLRTFLDLVKVITLSEGTETKKRSRSA